MSMNQEIIKIIYPGLYDLEELSQEEILKEVQYIVGFEGTREGKKELKELINIEADDKVVRILTARLDIAEAERAYRNDFLEMMPEVPSRKSGEYRIYDRLADSRIELALAMSLAVGEASLFGFVSIETNHYVSEKVQLCQEFGENFGHGIFGEKIAGSENYIWSRASKKKPKISDFGYAFIFDPNAKWDGKTIHCEAKPELLNLGFEFGGGEILRTVEKVPYIRKNKIDM